MLRPDFATIYRACAERGFLLTVNTNGTLLTDEIFDLFREHPPLRVNVSLYGFSEAVYSNLCGNGAAFFRAQENILRLRELGISVQLNFSATPFNAKALPEVYKFAESIGAPVQHTAYMFPPTRKSCTACFARFSAEEAGQSMFENLRLRHSPEDFSAICKLMLEASAPRADECGIIQDGVRCRGGRAGYWVTFDGNMLPCGMVPQLRTPVLNSSFQAAWEKTVAAFEAVRAPRQCLSCEHYSRCDVCPAICHAEHGDFSTVPKYICRKNQAYRDLLSKFSEETRDAPCD